MSHGKGVQAKKRPKPGELALLRVRVEQRCATRAQCVLDYIDMAQWHETPRFQRPATPPKLQGKVDPIPWKHLHGEKRTKRRELARRRSFWHPGETEAHLQKINRMMREHMADHPHDGMVAGPLAVAAKYAIEEFMQDAYELPGPEHAAALYTYLVDKMGMVMHQFDRDEYLAWRAQCRQRAAS